MNLSMPLARSFSRSPESVSEACEVAITSGPLPVNSKAVFMERLLDELHDGKQWYDHSICLFYQNHHRGPSPTGISRHELLAIAATKSVAGHLRRCWNHYAFFGPSSS